MKKIVFSLLLSFSLSFSFSQTNCVPDTLNFDLFGPVADSFPCIVRTIAYSYPIHLYVPDTFATIRVDSAKITSIVGLPTGMTYLCTPSGCVFLHGKHGCINFTGTTTDTVGTYPVTVSGYIYTQRGRIRLSQLQALGGPSNVYPLIVIDTGDTCRPVHQVVAIKNLSIDKEGFTMYPNPAHRSVQIKLPNTNTDAVLTVSDLVGKQVAQVSLNSSTVTFNTEAWGAGLYFVKLNNSKGLSVTQKLIVE